MSLQAGTGRLYSPDPRDREHLNETVKRLRGAGIELEVRSNPGGER